MYVSIESPVSVVVNLKSKEGEVGGAVRMSRGVGFRMGIVCAVSSMAGMTARRASICERGYLAGILQSRDSPRSPWTNEMRQSEWLRTGVLFIDAILAYRLTKRRAGCASGVTP